MRSVIRFLQVEGNSAAEVHRRMLRVYGENCVSDGVLREWCQKFKDGRTDIHHEEGQGRKSVTTEDIAQRVHEMVRVNSRFTIAGLSVKFPLVSRSSLYSIVTKHLGYRKICASWLPKQLDNDHKIC